MTINEVGKAHGDRIAYVDGLRAIAIIPVVLFHLGALFVPGGFLGVDVFFVISGFVITRSLANSYRRGHASPFTYLEGFYRRRFWRLAPALGVMLLATLIVSILVVPPSWLSAQNAATGVAAIFGVSNIALALMSDAGYFEARTEFNPFVHTWSLGVEEQFYVLVPLLLWLVFRGRGTHGGVVGLVIPGVATASLLLAIAWGTQHAEIAFYLLPTRFWELAAGVLAFHYVDAVRRRTGDRSRRLFGWMGMAAIAAGYLGLGGEVSPFPAAVLPVAGAVLVLWFAPASGMMNRGMSAPMMTYIGRISYSLYLWHWPVIVFLRWTIGDDKWWIQVSAAAASFAFAAASYHLVELPFQRWRPARLRLRPVVFVAAATAVAFMAGSVLAFNQRVWFPSTSPIAHQFGWRANELPDVGTVAPKTSAGDAPVLFVVGDSHAAAYAGMAFAAANELGMSAEFRSEAPCSFNLLEPVEWADCPGLRERFAKIRRGDAVMFASLRLPRFVEQTGPTRTPDLTSTAAKSRQEKAVDQFVGVAEALTSRGAIVIADSPKPLFKQPLFRCLSWPTNLNPMCDAPTTVSRRELMERARPAATGLATVQRRVPSVVVWDAFNVLCPEDPCSLFDSAGHPLYVDQDHLTGWGNELLLPSFLHVLRSRIPHEANKPNDEPAGTGQARQASERAD